MSTAATPAFAPELENYAQAWAKSLAAARPPISAATCEMSAQAPSNAPAAGDGDIWITATSSGELAGVVSFRFNRAGARRLVQTAPGEKPEAGEELSADHKAALLDWMRRAALAVPAHLPGPRDIQFQVDFADDPFGNPGATFWFLIADRRCRSDCVGSSSGRPVCAGPAVDDFCSGPSDPIRCGVVGEQVGHADGCGTGGNRAIWRRRMLLKDILDLCAGSVVDLDQEVQEPVDLMLDGKLIARGEVSWWMAITD